MVSPKVQQAALLFMDDASMFLLPLPDAAAQVELGRAASPTAGDDGPEEQPSLDLSDYVISDDVLLLLPGVSLSPANISPAVRHQPAAPFVQTAEDPTSPAQTTPGSMNPRTTTDHQMTFVFRTQSRIDVLDDGYKWRKYGKKPIKNTPYPRHYFRCTAENCFVKKTVDRDPEESSYVMTAYRGKHRHPPPSPAGAAAAVSYPSTSPAPGDHTAGAGAVPFREPWAAPTRVPHADPHACSARAPYSSSS